MSDPLSPPDVSAESQAEPTSDPALAADPFPSAPAGADPWDPFAPIAPPPIREAHEIYAQEIPPDNEHGDGVRNPPDRPCAGIRGNGLLTPKVYSKAEDWKDYNYNDFSY